jgi:2-methylcitrate dehydratase PrpD
MPRVTEELAQFAAAATLDQVDPDAVVATRRLLIESVATAAFGSQLSLGRRLATPLGWVRHGPAVPSSAACHDVARAAFLNAAWTDCNDSAGGATKVALHPGKNVLPAAFSAWVLSGRSGSQLVLASAVGIEVAYRLAMAVGLGHKLRGHYSDGTVGAIGSAVAVAKLYDLGVREIASAIGHACLIAPVTIGGAAMYPSEGRPLAMGAAASAGVMAADMAGHHVQGLDRPVEGAAGFLQALSDSGRPDIATDGLGDRWHVGSSYLKPYVGCRLTHAEREAVVTAMRERQIDPIDIVDVRLQHPSQDMPVIGHHAQPDGNPVAHSCSSSYLIANAIRYGDLGPEVLGDGRMHDQGLHEFANRVRVEADPALTEAYARCAANPGARRRRPVRVTMMLNGGQTITLDCDSARGDPDPGLEMTDLELRDKFLAFMSGALTPGDAYAFFDLLENLDSERPSAVLELLAASRDVSGRSLDWGCGTATA